MGIYRLERGLVVQLGERKLVFQRQIDNETIQFEDIRTGAFTIFKVGDFITKVGKGALSIYSVNGDASDLGITRLTKPSKVTVVAYRLNTKQKEQWELRSKYVLTLRKRGVTKGQKKRIEELLPILAKKFDDTSPPSVDSVMRWMRKFEQRGANIESLVSGNAIRETQLRIALPLRQLIQATLRKRYFVRNGDSLRSVYQRVANSLNESPVSDPPLVLSESTVRRIAAETDPYHRDRARYGASYAAAKWRHAIGGVYATRPMQRVEIDHTLLDLYVLDDKRGIPLGRPTITMLIDAYSGYILSLYVSFEGGSIGRIAQAIKFSLQPKFELVKALGLTNGWHTPGIWETLVLDNGLEFHSSQMRTMSMELCCDLEYCPVRKPWFKPVIERAMLELARILPIPGRPEKFLGVKDVVDPKRSACVMFSDLCNALVKWAVDVHPLQVNERKVARPIDLLLEGLENMPPPAFVDDLRSLDVIGGIAKTMRVRHSGIEMQSLTYRSPELADMAKQIAPSFSTNIKINVDDLGSIWVQHPKDATWINVPATHGSYAKGLTLFQHKLIRAHAKEKLKKMGAAEALLKAQSELQDMWDVSIRGGKRLKAAGTKKLAMLEGMRSSAVFARNESAVPVEAERVVTRKDLVVTPTEIPVFESFDLSTYLR